MMVIVLRLIFIFGTVAGMEIGPFSASPDLFGELDRRYENFETVAQNFAELKTISCIAFIYWMLASVPDLISKSVAFSTKLFKILIGLSILVLIIGSFLPDHAIELANAWFPSSFRPQMKI